MADPIDLVRRFCAAWKDVDLDAIMAFFADDAVYHNIPVNPVQGKEQIRATIAGFTAGVDSIEFRVRNIAAAGSTVLTERVDVFHFGGESGAHVIELPVMGTFEIDGDHVTAWRDYFDLNQFMSQMPKS